MGVIGVIGRNSRMCWGTVYDVSTIPVAGMVVEYCLPSGRSRCCGTRGRSAGDGYE